MTKNTQTLTLAFMLIAGALPLNHQAAAAELSAGQQAVESNAQNGKFSFVLFYRSKDSATQSMQQVLQSTLANRKDASIVSVQISDNREQALIDQFDATRIPMPAVAVLAPNGAIASVFPQRVTPQHLTAAIVSPTQAECLKALQDQKIVLLCAHPEEEKAVPAGVTQFQNDALFKDRTQVVTVKANDPAEARFLQQLRVRTDHPTSIVAFMAPPGIMLGLYNENVTHSILAQRLAAAGQCCDDTNCKHHKSASGKQAPRR
ncbi:hypothetical protein [Thalassoglobus polymorphus]|uniref:Uncharacterized protein n=1 Tax=Thalassoglobus polymorphus TaxID=2527994 RepID=A0A517QL40_9PLAN|nr:hypothetical protein [Thalassoglobus polymorphus]QDT32348.1 hypothetical protein Mal48_15920 [Thalassoglobus polymorphus]